MKSGQRALLSRDKPSHIGAIERRNSGQCDCSNTSLWIERVKRDSNLQFV